MIRDQKKIVGGRGLEVLSGNTNSKGALLLASQGVSTLFLCLVIGTLLLPTCGIGDLDTYGYLRSFTIHDIYLTRARIIFSATLRRCHLLRSSSRLITRDLRIVLTNERTLGWGLTLNKIMGSQGRICGNKFTTTH